MHSILHSDEIQLEFEEHLSMKSDQSNKRGSDVEDIDREEEQSLDIIEQHLASNAKKRKEASSSKKEREQNSAIDQKINEGDTHSHVGNKTADKDETQLPGSRRSTIQSGKDDKRETPKKKANNCVCCQIF